MFLPTVIRPVPTTTAPGGPAAARLERPGIGLIAGRPGADPAEAVAALVAAWGRWPDCAWLRVDGRRDQAGALGHALAAACAYHWGGPAQPASLAGAIALAPAGAALVVELPSPRRAAGFAALLGQARPAVLARGVRLLVVTGRRPTRAMARVADTLVAATDLRPDAPVDAPLDGPAGARLAALTRAPGTRALPALERDLAAAARLWGAGALAEAVAGAGSAGALTDRVTAALLGRCGPAQLAALEVAVATGYWHPRLGTGEAGAAELRPWLVQLEHGWGRLRPLWARALARHLPRQRPAPTSATSARATSARATSSAAIAPPAATRGAADLALEPEAHAGIVEAGLLGAIEFRVDGVTLPAPAGQRGLSVLRYLLARPSHACSRDELLAEFWPEVAPEVARNRLQVAVSALRRALAEITRLPVIEYAAGGYRLNPELLVAVDVERFEEALASARAAERAGDAEAALVAYAKAVELYRGDFAADAPYEQWTLLARETLRLAYLDALDRVSRLQLDLGRLDDAIASALRMLGLDPCREDAHRLLMGCYAAQGRASQALRQYDYCRRVLRATIDAEPEPATTRLARTIKEGSMPEPSLIG